MPRYDQAKQSSCDCRMQCRNPAQVGNGDSQEFRTTTPGVLDTPVIIRSGTINESIGRTCPWHDGSHPAMACIVQLEMSKRERREAAAGFPNCTPTH